MATNGLTGNTSKFSDGFTKFSLTATVSESVTLSHPFDEEGFIEIVIQSATGMSSYRVYNPGKHVPATAPLLIKDNNTATGTVGAAAIGLVVGAASSAAHTIYLVKSSTTGAITLVNTTGTVVATTVWVRMFA